jgi:hypothetical protein
VEEHDRRSVAGADVVQGVAVDVGEHVDLRTSRRRGVVAGRYLRCTGCRAPVVRWSATGAAVGGALTRGDAAGA